MSTGGVPGSQPPDRWFGAAPWHRALWRLALPIMLANVSTPLLGLVDTAVVGRLGEASYIGGAALGALIFTFVFWAFGFLRMGTTGLTAQAFGAEDGTEVLAVIGRALILAAGIGVALVVLQMPIRWLTLSLFDASAAVEAQAAGYFDARIWGAPATLGNYAVLGWLLGMQRTGLALLLQVVLNGVNIVFSLLFVLVLEFGVPGVGAASALAEWTALALGLLLVVRVRRPLTARLETGRETRLGLGALGDGAAYRRLFAINRDLFLRTLCLMLGFAWFTNQGARMGDTVLAANAVLLNFQTFAAYALDGFAHAAETLVGHRLGARDRRGFDQAVRAGAVWSVLGGAAFGLVFLVAGPAIIDTLTTVEAVRAVARDYLPWVVALPFVAAVAFLLDGVFIGATQGPTLRNAMAASLAVFLLAAWVLVPLAGNHGLWLAFSLFTGARGITLALAYRPLIRRAFPAAGGAIA